MTMMSRVRIEKLEWPTAGLRSIEIVERKGLGHPDTICDMLSERLSVSLSRHYLKSFGQILHHNVDKALLAAGRANAAFGAGQVIEPIDLYLSGRATIDFAGQQVAIVELARETVGEFFRDNFHALDPEKHVRLHCLVRPGSRDLLDMTLRRTERGLPLCNDTSCGVGFAPLTELEKIVLAVEHRLNAPETKLELPACGQDVKIMGVRNHERMTITIACAMIGRFLSDLDAYADATHRVVELATDVVRAVTDKPVELLVNAADEPARGSVYLTVTGTSAESGDDGETGRGNRSNGLITPLRPMSLEAAAGKNPLTHVGKLYNTAAQQIADDLVEVEEIEAAECYLVSKIGAPIDQPQAMVVRMGAADRRIGRETERQVEEIVAKRMVGVARLWERFLLGELSVC